jgi:hypothetical protein
MSMLDRFGRRNLRGNAVEISCEQRKDDGILAPTVDHVVRPECSFASKSTAFRDVLRNRIFRGGRKLNTLHAGLIQRPPREEP